MQVTQRLIEELEPAAGNYACALPVGLAADRCSGRRPPSSASLLRRGTRARAPLPSLPNRSSPLSLLCPHSVPFPNRSPSTLSRPSSRLLSRPSPQARTSVVAHRSLLQTTSYGCMFSGCSVSLCSGVPHLLLTTVNSTSTVPAVYYRSSDQTVMFNGNVGYTKVSYCSAGVPTAWDSSGYPAGCSTNLYFGGAYMGSTNYNYMTWKSVSTSAFLSPNALVMCYDMNSPAPPMPPSPPPPSPRPPPSTIGCAFTGCGVSEGVTALTRTLCNYGVALRTRPLPWRLRSHHLDSTAGVADNPFIAPSSPAVSGNFMQLSITTSNAESMCAARLCLSPRLGPCILCAFI